MVIFTVLARLQNLNSAIITRSLQIMHQERKHYHNYPTALLHAHLTPCIPLLYAYINPPIQTKFSTG